MHKRGKRMGRHGREYITRKAILHCIIEKNSCSNGDIRSFLANSHRIVESPHAINKQLKRLRELEFIEKDPLNQNKRKDEHKLKNSDSPDFFKRIVEAFELTTDQITDLRTYLISHVSADTLEKIDKYVNQSREMWWLEGEKLTGARGKGIKAIHLCVELYLHYDGYLQLLGQEGLLESLKKESDKRRKEYPHLAERMNELLIDTEELKKTEIEGMRGILTRLEPYKSSKDITRERKGVVKHVLWKVRNRLYDDGVDIHTPRWYD